MAKKKLRDFIAPKVEKKPVQIKLDEGLFNDFRTALTKKNETAQEVLEAAVKMYLAEVRGE